MVCINKNIIIPVLCVGIVVVGSWAETVGIHEKLSMLLELIFGVVFSNLLCMTVSTTQKELVCPTCNNNFEYCRLNFTREKCVYHSPYKLSFDDLRAVTLRTLMNHTLPHVCLDALYTTTQGVNRSLKMCRMVTSLTDFCQRLNSQKIMCLVTRLQEGGTNGEVWPPRETEDEDEDYFDFNSGTFHAHENLLYFVFIFVLKYLR